MLGSPGPIAPAPAGAGAPFFGVCFLGKSYPIWDTVLTRVDATHWVSGFALGWKLLKMADQDHSRTTQTTSAESASAWFGEYVLCEMS
jgi:hypothetical protein